MEILLTCDPDDQNYAQVLFPSRNFLLIQEMSSDFERAWIAERNEKSMDPAMISGGSKHSGWTWEQCAKRKNARKSLRPRALSVPADWGGVPWIHSLEHKPPLILSSILRYAMSFLKKMVVVPGCHASPPD
jgi:hypothetical protein